MTDQLDLETHHEAPQPSDITDIERRLAFLEMTEVDRRHLRKLAGDLKPSALAFVETFYRHLFSFEETARFLQDPLLVERLKQSQLKHLETMLAADWTPSYVERRYRVGDVHAKVGINPQIFLGSYSQYLQFCLRHLAAGMDEPAKLLAEHILSLQKAVFFDVGLTLEAYFTRTTQSLRQALDLVYKANSELRQFAQLTSHDLKTPLATVANLCDEALDEFKDEMPAGAAELIESARNRAFRMSRTIDELLSSTISLHEESPHETVALNQTVADAIDQLRPLLEQKNITLTVMPGLPRVVGDRVRLREVFYNLISNAIKFIDKINGKISVGFAIRDGDCLLSVADNGSGIPAEDLSRIFVPFRRLPAHREIPGSGLGLYFVKTIVEQQQGRVWVESEVGKGSCFYVLLKLAQQVNGV